MPQAVVIGSDHYEVLFGLTVFLLGTAVIYGSWMLIFPY